MPDIFLNKVAVVTGGASGLGAALAKELVAKGATIIIADIAHERAQEVAAALGKRAHAIAVDVRTRNKLLRLCGASSRISGRWICFSAMPALQLMARLAMSPSPNGSESSGLTSWV